MLARLARELPVGDVVYEPKWDGFRCVAFVCAGEVDLRSRNQKPLGRYFPEVVEALSAIGAELVLDGELLVTRDGELHFDALLERVPDEFYTWVRRTQDDLLAQVISVSQRRVQGLAGADNPAQAGVGLVTRFIGEARQVTVAIRPDFNGVADIRGLSIRHANRRGCGRFRAGAK